MAQQRTVSKHIVRNMVGTLPTTHAKIYLVVIAS